MSFDDHPRIAICQPYVVFGGRLQVILGMVRVLNELDIVPDILVLRRRFEPHQIQERYGQSVRVNFRELAPRVPAPSSDLAVFLFHALLRRQRQHYDLMLNSSNSVIFLARRQPTLHYVHFPRERRIADQSPDIHLPDMRYRLFSRRWLRQILVRQVYRLSHPQPEHHFVFNSQFTRESLAEIYPEMSSKGSIIYPPVDFKDYQNPGESRQRAIVSVGRFARNKRQLEQIQLAEKMPDMPFHIVGFANISPYYRQCQDYVRSHQLANVHLHPDAPFEEMIALLQNSKYFLHTMINEPFGLTAIQAMAAGCIPIVHDSGGQRETIPLPDLRYQSLEEVPAMLERLEALPDTEILAMMARLQVHAQTNFDEGVFHTGMREILVPLLESLSPN